MRDVVPVGPSLSLEVVLTRRRFLEPSVAGRVASVVCSMGGGRMGTRTRVFEGGLEERLRVGLGRARPFPFLARRRAAMVGLVGGDEESEGGDDGGRTPAARERATWADEDDTSTGIDGLESRRGAAGWEVGSVGSAGNGAGGVLR